MERGELEPFGPKQIRALRGAVSRAVFARRLGVTPLTVYRWELPDGSPEARRPRGRILRALTTLGLGGAGGDASAATAGQPAATQPAVPEQQRIWSVLARAYKAEWKQAEEEP